MVSFLQVLLSELRERLCDPPLHSTCPENLTLLVFIVPIARGEER
jgi:hypothetical protein